MLGNVNDICDSEQSDGFTCPGGRTVFSSSVIWGAIGPARLYGVGKIYSGLLHFFWIGALMPLVTWVIWKYWKETDGKGRDWLRLINWPLIFVGTYNVPPVSVTFFVNSSCCGFLHPCKKQCFNPSLFLYMAG